MTPLPPNPLERFWAWLTVPDANPGYSTTKLLKLAVRLMLFSLVVTLVSVWLQLTPLRPYIQSWWSSLLLVVGLYAAFYRFLTVDGFAPAPRRQAGQNAVRVSDMRIRPTAAQRRKEKKRYAGVSKPPPRLGGRR